MNDAGRANPNRDTVLKLAGASPPAFSPSPATASAAVSDGDAPRAVGEPIKPTLQPKAPTCLDRLQILDATARVLREKGYDGTTIRAIAKQLNCAVGSIYRYFDGKRTLLDAVCQRRFEAVVEHAELRSSVYSTILSYAKVATEQPEQYRLMFWLASVGQQQQGEAMPDVISRVINAWAETLGTASQARSLWAQLHGYIMLGVSAEQAITMLDLNGPRHASDTDTAPLAIAQPPAESFSSEAAATATSPSPRSATNDDVTLL